MSCSTRYTNVAVHGETCNWSIIIVDLVGLKPIQTFAQWHTLITNRRMFALEFVSNKSNTVYTADRAPNLSRIGLRLFSQTDCLLARFSYPQSKSHCLQCSQTFDSRQPHIFYSHKTHSFRLSSFDYMIGENHAGRSGGVQLTATRLSEIGRH